VGLIAGLDTDAGGKILCPIGDLTPVALSIVRQYSILTELPHVFATHIGWYYSIAEYR
jgi:hypothetical protein